MEIKTKLGVAAAGLFAVLITFMVFGCLDGQGGNEEFSLVPADAIVAGSVDVQYVLVKEKDAWNKIDDRTIKSKTWDELLEDMEKEVGVNLKNISRIEFYMSDTNGENIGVVLYGKINKNRLLGLLDDRGEYKKGTYKDVTIYTEDVSYKSNLGMVAFIDENTFAAGTSSGVKSIIDVKKGVKNNFLSNSKNAEINNKLGKGNIKVIAYVEEEMLGRTDLTDTGLDVGKINSIGYRDGINGMLSIIECSDEDSAEDLKDILAGKIAMVKDQMKTYENEVPAEYEGIFGDAKDLIKSIKLERSGRDVRVTGNEFVTGLGLIAIFSGFQSYQITDSRTNRGYTGFLEVKPTDYSFESDRIRLGLVNLAEQGIEVKRITMISEGVATCIAEPERTLSAGEMEIFECICDNSLKGRQYLFETTIEYRTKVTNLDKESIGEIWINRYHT